MLSRTFLVLKQILNKSNSSGASFSAKVGPEGIKLECGELKIPGTPDARSTLTKVSSNLEKKQKLGNRKTEFLRYFL